MPSITIEFNTPVLQPGEKFKVSYTMLPSGTIVNLPDKTDNDDLVIDGLSEGAYILHVALVKADDTICPTTNIPFNIDPPPVDPPDPNPVDPPPTSQDPCLCVGVDEAKIVKSCDGSMKLELTISYPANNVPCQLKIYHKNGTGSETLTVVSNGATGISIPISSIVSLKYRIEMVCCTDNTTSACISWTDVTDVEDCECDTPPDITITGVSYISMPNSQYIINIIPSSPSLPPYTVTFSVGTYTHSQTFNSAGSQLFDIPIAFTNAFLTVSNYCGSKTIPITQTRCKDTPIITLIERDLVNNTVTITWINGGQGGYLVEIYGKDGYPPAAYNVLVPQGTFSHTFNVSSIFANGQYITARVSDDCGLDSKTQYF